MRSHVQDYVTGALASEAGDMWEEGIAVTFPPHLQVKNQHLTVLSKRRRQDDAAAARRRGSLLARHSADSVVIVLLFQHVQLFAVSQ